MYVCQRYTSGLMLISVCLELSEILSLRPAFTGINDPLLTNETKQNLMN